MGSIVHLVKPPQMVTGDWEKLFILGIALSNPSLREGWDHADWGPYISWTHCREELGAGLHGPAARLWSLDSFSIERLTSQNVHSHLV